MADYVKINESKIMEQLADSDYITVVLADSSLARIKKSDLYPVATTTSNGLMRASDKVKLGSFGCAVLGFTDERWLLLFEFDSNGWNLLDVEILMHARESATFKAGRYIFQGDMGRRKTVSADAEKMLGYTVVGSKVSIYARFAPGGTASGNQICVHANLTLNTPLIFTWLTAEPTGIIYF